MRNIISYDEAYDTLSYTPEQKTILAANAAAEAARKAQRPIRFGRFAKAAATAACLLSILTVTAEAAGIPTPVSGLLAPLFGSSAAQCQVIDTIGRPVDAKDTDNGVTIQADAIMGDGHNVSILFTIRRDDGTSLLPDGLTGKHLILGEDSSVSFGIPGGFGATADFVDAVQGDHEIQLLYTVTSSAKLLGETCTAVFDGLYYWDSASNSYAAALEGSWKLEFEMEYQDSAVSLGGGETFRQDDLTFTIQEISISPVAIHVAYDVDAPVQTGSESDAKLHERLERFIDVTILLTKTDGTILSLSNVGTTLLPENGITKVTKSAVHDSVLPLEELESITVGGITFPITE